MSLVRDFLK